MGRKARITSPDRIKRQHRIAAILSMRMEGWSLREIGDAQTPPVSGVAIFKTIRKALAEVVSDEVDEARKIELLRLDDLLVGLYPRAINGNVAAIDRVLAISLRRARLLGLDYIPSQVSVSRVDEDDRRDVRIEIVNAPEPAPMWGETPLNNFGYGPGR